MGWWSDWTDKMKKTFVFKAAKSVGRTGAKAVQYGAAPAGAFFFGPLGALGGTFLGAGAGQVGPTKNVGSQFQRDLIYGGAWTVGTAGLGLLSGAGIGAPISSSLTSFFGPTPAANSVTTGLENAFLGSGPSSAPAAPSGGGLTSALLGVASTAAASRAGGPNTAQLQQQYLEQLKLAEQLRAAGNVQGALQAEALAEMYRQQIVAGGGTPGANGGFPWGLVLIGGVALWLLTRGKAA